MDRPPSDPPRRAAPRWLLVALLLVTIGGALRVHDVGTLPLIGDEIYTLGAAEAAAVPAAARDESDRWQVRWAVSTTPLPHALDRVAVALLGPSPAAIRLFPCLLGLAALLLLPWCAARLWGGRVGLIALALLAFCPRHVEWSRMGRYESAAFLFGGLTVLCAGEWVRTRTRGALLRTLLAAGAVCASHPSGVLVPLAVAFALSVAAAAGRLGPRSARLPALGLLAVATIVYASAEVTGVMELLRTRFERSAAGHDAPRFLAAVAYNIGPLLALAAVGGGVRLLRTHDRLGVLVASAAALPLAALLAIGTVKDVGPRFYAAAEPAVVLLAALFVADLSARRRGPAAAASALVLLITAAQLPLLASDQLDGRRYDYPRVVARLREAAPGGELVLADNHAVVDHYLGRETFELPGTVAELEEWIRDLGAGRAFLVLKRQRGRLVFPAAARLEEWLARHARRIDRAGRRRLDDLLYRYEVELYEVTGLTPSSGD